MKKFKIKKGDQVQVTTGQDKGKRGEVMRVLVKEDRLIVKGVNMVSRHRRATQTNAGGIEQKEAAIHISNVALLDPKSDKPTRVGFKVTKDGDKQRVAKKSGEAIA